MAYKQDTFFTVLEAKIEVAEDTEPGENLFLGLQLTSSCVLTWQ